MRLARRSALFLLLAVVGAGTLTDRVQAQEAPAPPSPELVRLDLADGTTLVGEIVAETPEAITLRMAGGAEATVPRAQIRRSTPFEGYFRDGQIVRLDPNRTRLLFTPTARPLGAGEGYLAVYQLFVPFVAVGLTDEVSLSGGTLLLPGAFGRVLYVAPKVTFYERELLSLAVGGVGLGVFVEDDRTTAGIGYGLATYGTQERAFTVGAGAAFAEGELTSGLILMVGGELQLSNSVKLVTENFLLPFREEVYTQTSGSAWELRTNTRYEPIFGVGVRFFGERLAVDLAGVTAPSLLGTDVFPFIPWVGFAYNFGR